MRSVTLKVTFCLLGCFWFIRFYCKYFSGMSFVMRVMILKSLVSTLVFLEVNAKADYVFIYWNYLSVVIYIICAFKQLASVTNMYTIELNCLTIHSLGWNLNLQVKNSVDLSVY